MSSGNQWSDDKPQTANLISLTTPAHTADGQQGENALKGSGGQGVQGGDGGVDAPGKFNVIIHAMSP